MTRIAIIDGASFVLPYDLQLVQALARRGVQVDFYGSCTRYNGELLEAMRATPGVTVYAADISRTSAPRWRGVLNYAGLLLRLWRRRHRYAFVNLQFSVLWPIEWPLCWLLRRKLVYTVHNAVPHGYAAQRHRPTESVARMAMSLVFVSRSTRDDFARRYGDHWLNKSSVLPHGLLPLAPGRPPVPYASVPSTQTLVYWSTVKRYKGVELFAELARSTGPTLEVHGAWDTELHPLRNALIAAGVKVNDAYLNAAQLDGLLSRNVVFMLPYHGASQSGALYTLLNAGRVFLCSDVGDLGDFMRTHGLADLLLAERNAAAVQQCLKQLEANGPVLMMAFAQAQAAMDWDTLLATPGTPYAGL